MDLLITTCIAVIGVSFLEWSAKKQKEIDYLVNPLNMRAILKRCYYDERQKQHDLLVIQELVRELQSKMNSRKKEFSLPLVMAHGNTEYLSILRLEIKEGGYEKELLKKSKEDQLLDNWDDF